MPAESLKHRRAMNVLTLEEFLTRNRLTAADLRFLKEEGAEPLTIDINGRILVSRKAERDWLRNMEGRGSTPPRRRISRRL